MSLELDLIVVQTAEKHGSVIMLSKSSCSK